MRFVNWRAYVDQQISIRRDAVVICQGIGEFLHHAVGGTRITVVYIAAVRINRKRAILTNNDQRAIWQPRRRVTCGAGNTRYCAGGVSAS